MKYRILEHSYIEHKSKSEKTLETEKVLEVVFIPQYKKSLFRFWHSFLVDSMNPYIDDYIGFDTLEKAEQYIKAEIDLQSFIGDKIHDYPLQQTYPNWAGGGKYPDKIK